MIHESSNLIYKVSYSGDYLPPVSKLCVWVVFISHLNVPQQVPSKGGNPGDTVCKARFCHLVFNILFIRAKGL